MNMNFCSSRKSNLIGRSTFTVLAALAIGSAPAWAAPEDQTFFTNFADVANQDPNNFRFGPATFTGSSVGSFIVGVPQLYSSESHAWMAGPGETVRIDFDTPMQRVEFFAIGLDGAVVRALGQVDQPSETDVSGSSFTEVAYSGAITGLEFENTSSAPPVGNFGAYGASIDDIGFSPPIPEPSTAALLALGGWLLLRNRRSA